MQGVVFNLLESFVTDGWGAETYEELLARCPVHTRGPYVGPGTYSDQDFLTLVGQAAGLLNLPVRDAVKAFGAYAFPKLASRYPAFTAQQVDPKEFLMTVDRVVHVEVRKALRGAHPPEFRMEDTGPLTATLRYRSDRKLCAFAEGLLEGVSAYFGTPLALTHTRCMHDGAPHCEFQLRFGAAALGQEAA